jgi:hypothetical protein
MAILIAGSIPPSGVVTADAASEQRSSGCLDSG